MGIDKNCDNCIHSGKPSYEYPCTACVTAFGSSPSKWESMFSATADMVEVVRCKNCNNCTKNMWCNLLMMEVKPDVFCSYGKKKI